MDLRTLISSLFLLQKLITTFEKGSTSKTYTNTDVKNKSIQKKKE